MIQTTAHIEGMACPMCESHINEAVRKAFSVRKVSSSHKKGVTEILSDQPLDADTLRGVIAATGYTLRDISSQPYEKKGFFLFR